MRNILQLKRCEVEIGIFQNGMHEVKFGTEGVLFSCLHLLHIVHCVWHE